MDDGAKGDDDVKGGGGDEPAEQAGPLVQLSITRRLVGRVIGRGGLTIQRIRAQTQVIHDKN